MKKPLHKSGTLQRAERRKYRSMWVSTRLVGLRDGRVANFGGGTYVRTGPRRVDVLRAERAAKRAKKQQQTASAAP